MPAQFQFEATPRKPTQDDGLRYNDQYSRCLHRQDSRISTKVLFPILPSTCARRKRTGELGKRPEEGKALGCSVGSKFSFLRQHRFWCHQRNAATSVQALAAMTSWRRFNKRRVQKPRSCADFIFPNRLACPALLVGSWVHFSSVLKFFCSVGTGMVPAVGCSMHSWHLILVPRYWLLMGSFVMPKLINF